MSNKQSIPIPAAQRWQDFRQILLPLIVFSLCILGLGLLWWNKIAPSTVVGEARSDNIVISSPRAGLLKEVHVGRFDEIKAGEPIAEGDVALACGDARDHRLEVLDPMLSVGVEVGDPPGPVSKGEIGAGLERRPLAAIDEVAKWMGGAVPQDLPGPIRRAVVDRDHILEAGRDRADDIPDRRRLVEHGDDDPGLVRDGGVELRLHVPISLLGWRPHQINVT